MNIKSGDAIQSPRWPEPVEIKLVEDMGGYVRIVGATINSRTHVDQLLSQGEVNQIQYARTDTILMGAMNFLQSRFNRMDVTLHVEEGHITEQEFEDKIKEVFRQIGVEIEDEVD